MSIKRNTQSKNTSIANNMVKPSNSCKKLFLSTFFVIMREGAVSSLLYPDENFRKPKKAMYLESEQQQMV